MTNKVRIGIQTALIDSGFNRTYINSSGCKLDDLRTLLIKVGLKDVLFMSVDTKGVSIIHCHTISGRDGDQGSMSIYLPKGIKIEFSELKDAYDLAKEACDKSPTDINEKYKDKFDGLCIKEHDFEEPLKWYSDTSANTESAYIEVAGNDLLQELYKYLTYQSFFQDKKYIFFIPKGTPISGNVKKLDVCPEEYVQLKTPKVPEEFDGFYSVLQHPERDVKKGQQIWVTWTGRDGYLNVEKDYKAGGVLPILEEGDIKRHIDRNSLNRPQEAKINSIKFNNKKNEADIPYSDLSKVKVEIECDGYENYNGTLNFSGVNTPSVNLNKMDIKTTVLIGGKNPLNQKKDLNDFSEGLYRLKIEGPKRSIEYTLSFDLEPEKTAVIEEKSPSNKFFNKSLLIGALCMFALCGAAFGVSVWQNWVTIGEVKTPTPQAIKGSDPIEKKPTPVNSESTNVQSQVKDTIDYSSKEAAIEYLDRNYKWNDDKMNKYDLLKGLFIDMKFFNDDDLKNKWADTLKKSNKFKEFVLDPLNSSKSEKIDRNDKTDFLQDEGKTIHLESYKKHILKTIETSNQSNSANSDQNKANNTKAQSNSGRPSTPAGGYRKKDSTCSTRDEKN